jgi:hypothetical protein
VVVGRVLLPLFGFSLSVGGGVAEESALWLLVRSVRGATVRAARTVGPPATRQAARPSPARATERLVRGDILALVVATFWGVLASLGRIFRFIVWLLVGVLLLKEWVLTVLASSRLLDWKFDIGQLGNPEFVEN